MKKTILLICFSLVLFQVFPDSFREDFEADFLKNTNSYRASRNLSPLVYDEGLEDLAEWFCEKMVANKMVAHRVATAEQWQAKARELEVRRWCKELLVGIPAEALSASWCLVLLIDSPEHNKALLFDSGAAFGVAYIISKGYAYVTVYIGAQQSGVR